ncbi:SH3 domain-containing protein [Leptospira noumeaensis]|uniref:SH3 domain-containing protein n=2 Tax=Leptospira noumeaensis TaxID=2484964 RepID=A0A4V3JIY1_9LEPT|nr:SH3 domain-containing protein [Leptospira noumeaensis]
MKKTKYFGLILILLLHFCKDQTENSEQNNFIFVKGKNIHLRVQPDQKSKSLGFLQGGNKLEIVSESNDKTKIDEFIGKWIKVKVLSGKLKDNQGFVFSQFTLEKNISPIDLIYKETEITKRNKFLEKLKLDFPEYDEIGLYSFDELINFEIFVNDCKVKRIDTSVGFEQKEELIREFQNLQSNFSEAEFEKMTTCEFLWANYCGGTDILPYPYFSYSNKNSIKQIISSLNIESGDKENCYQTIDNKKYCFHISKTNEKFLIGGLCQMHINQK